VRTRSLIAVLVCVALTVPPTCAYADQRPGHERVDFTAYTLRRNEFSLGLWTQEYGLLDEITLGTYLVTWFAFPVVRAPVASGFVKFRDWLFGPIAVSARATFLYLNATALSHALSKNTSTDSGFLVLPLELAASARIDEHFSESLQLTWVHVGLGGGKPSDTSLDAGFSAAAAVSSLSLTSFTEFRISRVVAFTLRGTVLLATSDLVAHAQYEENGTRVDADLGAVSHYRKLIGNVIPGVAFSWDHVNLELGVGLGQNWLPVVWLPTLKVTVVPDVNFYVRF
jgi:hypothetical protein